MKKPTKRSVALVSGVSALVLGGAVAAVGADVVDDHAIDPSKSEVTITDESYLDDELISTTVTTYDAEGNVIETSTTTP